MWHGKIPRDMTGNMSHGESLALETILLPSDVIKHGLLETPELYFHDFPSRLMTKPSLFGGDWNMTFMTFHSVGNVIIPTDEVHHFSEG